MEACAHHLSNQRRSCGGIGRDARLFWKYQSRAASSKPKISAATVALIKAMAAQNRRLVSGTDPWRIPQAGHPRLQMHHSEVHETCSHTKTTRTELGHLRSLFAFFILDMHSRKVIHVGVHTSPRSPTDAWTARTAAGGDSLWTIAELSHARS